MGSVGGANAWHSELAHSLFAPGVKKIIQFRESLFCRDLFLLAAIRTGWFGIVGWVGRSPGVVANSTSLEMDGPTISHGVQPTIFRANSSLLRTNDIEAAREMVGCASHKLEGRGRKQALNQPGFGFNIGHFHELSSRQSSFRAKRYMTQVSIKQLDSVFSGNFSTGTCSVDPESRWPNLEPSPPAPITMVSTHPGTLRSRANLRQVAGETNSDRKYTLNER